VLDLKVAKFKLKVGRKILNTKNLILKAVFFFTCNLKFGTFNVPEELSTCEASQPRRMKKAARWRLPKSFGHLSILFSSKGSIQQN
jgi:hypothetical protein